MTIFSPFIHFVISPMSAAPRLEFSLNCVVSADDSDVGTIIPCNVDAESPEDVYPISQCLMHVLAWLESFKGLLFSDSRV